MTSYQFNLLYIKMTAIYNKQEGIYSITIPLYLWIDEQIPDYFEPLMTEFSWVMDEFKIHFFHLSDEIISELNKMTVEYIIDNKANV